MSFNLKLAFFLYMCENNSIGKVEGDIGMAYGITSTSQIIDLSTILSGCAAYKTALKDFEKCGETVIKAGETCSSKALSVDNNTLQYPISDLGQAIKDLKAEYTAFAEEVEAQARKIYNAQVAEYNEYVAQKNAASNN